MKRLAQLLVFFLCFTIEVQVDARERVGLTENKSPQQQPENCIRESVYPCAIKTKSNEKAVWSLAHGGKITLDMDTAIVAYAGDHLAIVAGRVWALSQAEATIETEFGKAILAAGSEAWLERDAFERKMRVAVIQGFAELSPRGNGEHLSVSPGMQNWMGQVSTDGVATTGLPESIRIREHIIRWARLYEGKKTTFTIEARHLQKVFEEASEANSKLHQELVLRRIASLDTEAAHKAEIRREIERKNKQLREEFRNRLLRDDL